MDDHPAMLSESRKTQDKNVHIHVASEVSKKTSSRNAFYTFGRQLIDVNAQSVRIFTDDSYISLNYAGCAHLIITPNGVFFSENRKFVMQILFWQSVLLFWRVFYIWKIYNPIVNVYVCCWTIELFVGILSHNLTVL
jgi:hypothetical protein